jgi:hypothetical protein
MEYSQKVCPEHVRTVLDPFRRDVDGYATGVRSDMGMKMAAMIEFLIQVPVDRRYVAPSIMSMCTTSDHVLIVNGDVAGSSDVLESNLRAWTRTTGLAAGMETESFQAMIDANMGVPTACHRVTI